MTKYFITVKKVKATKSECHILIFIKKKKKKIKNNR